MQDPLSQPFRIFCFELNHIAADLRLQFCGSSQSNESALIENGEAVAALRLLHQVSGHKNGYTFSFPQAVQVQPQIATRTWIESRCGFVEEQNRWPMHQPFG